MRFRLGLENDNNTAIQRKYLGSDENGYYMPVYENSFYFYFGLIPGSTALDEFYKQFFAECKPTMTSQDLRLNMSISYNGYCCGGKRCTNGFEKPVEISIFETGATFTANDSLKIFSTAVPIKIVVDSEYVDTIKDAGNLDKVYNQTVKKVTSDFESLGFNTAIAQMMIFVNAVYKEGSCPREYAENFIKMLSCICPHVGEEIWQILGHDNTIAFEPWPSYDEAKCVEDLIEIVVQINGKVKEKLSIGKDDPKDEVIAKGKELIADKLEGKTIAPFCTHEGSGLSGTDSNIASATGAQVLTAIDMRGSTAQEFNDDTKQTVRTWLDGLGF
jgi:hypothetical protein